MDGAPRGHTFSSPLYMVEAELNNFLRVSKFRKKRLVLMFPEGLDPVINRYIQFLAERAGLETGFIGDQGAHRIVAYSQENFRANPPKIKIIDPKTNQTKSLQVCDKPEVTAENVLCKGVEEVWISPPPLNVECEAPQTSTTQKGASPQKDGDQEQATGSGLSSENDPTTPKSPAVKNDNAEMKDDGEPSTSDAMSSSQADNVSEPFNEEFHMTHENEELVLEIVELENTTSPGPSYVPIPDPQFEQDGDEEESGNEE
ncbi:uncharacterized protein LOC116165665 isoform X2 [Photinus pyralis]|nr:uncharacterized protein LOC116165665 isoform X2 [Photinus pyralis]